MATYKVTKEYKYYETVTVEAASEREAKDIAASAESKHDEAYLYACDAIKETKGK